MKAEGVHGEDEGVEQVEVEMKNSSTVPLMVKTPPMTPKAAEILIQISWQARLRLTLRLPLRRKRKWLGYHISQVHLVYALLTTGLTLCGTQTWVLHHI